MDGYTEGSFGYHAINKDEVALGIKQWMAQGFEMSMPDRATGDIINKFAVRERRATWSEIPDDEWNLAKEKLKEERANPGCNIRGLSKKLVALEWGLDNKRSVSEAARRAGMKERNLRSVTYQLNIPYPTR